MRVILKFAILIMSLLMTPSLFSNDFIYCGCLSIILFFALCYDILIKFKSFINGEYTIDEPRDYNNKLSQYDVGYLNNTSYYDVPKEHIRYANPMMERVQVVKEKSLDEIIKEKCNVKNKKFKIISKIDNPKKEKNSVLSSIKNMFTNNTEKNEEKKIEVKHEIKTTKEEKKNKEYIIFSNQKGLTETKRKVYDEIISLFKSKKYATSRICKLLNAIQHVNILKTTIVLYTNENQLDENEIIPKKEIMELLSKKFNMKIQFVKINNVSIFDYYLKTNSIP